MPDADAPSVRSEVGALRTVLVHRPDLELSRITPENKDELLFDELLWVERAGEEHDAFTATLAGAGCEVLHLHHLLEEVLGDGALRKEVVARHVTDTTCGPQLVDRVRGFLLELPPAELARRLVGGVALEEVAGPEGLLAAVSPPTEMVLHPLPNTVFVRDSSAFVAEGVVLAPMNRLVRRRETELLRLVYGRHPRFAGLSVWFGDEPGEHYPATVEGGDLLVVADRALAVGLSERTSPTGAEALIARLFAAGVVDRVLVVDLPRARSAMHLDTVVSMVDRDAFLIYPSIVPAVRCFTVTPGGGGRLDVRDTGGLVEGLAWATGLDRPRIIAPDLGSIRAAREQWNDANNTLAVRPGEVVAYERNVATNEVLADAGITVRTVPSEELPRGRGGPRCMSCPVRRDPLG